jgi:predicted DNA-binding protein (UPF0251 family)
MGRPKKRRRLCFCPKCPYFEPQTSSSTSFEEIGLLAEEIEAIKLHDFDDLDQNEAAESMEISQSTFARILASAHKKLAEAICSGKAIKIIPGDTKTPD